MRESLFPRMSFSFRNPFRLAPRPAPPLAATDEALAQQAQAGQVDAFAPLVERHHGPLVNFLHRMTGDRGLAEDLAQEAFFKATRALHQYDPARPFKPWLYAIATNLARNYYGQAELRHTDSASDHEATWENLPAHAPSPEEHWQTAEDERQVQSALLRLPAHQREVILLRYHHHHSLADIAALLNIPEGTVKSRLSLGIKRLRELLEVEQ